VLLLDSSAYLFIFTSRLSGMTDPPMQWGYPRTVEGFFHALSRGQYEKAHPTDIIHDPMHFMMQLGMLVTGRLRLTAGFICSSRCCRSYFHA
jgi:hypothetical protein